MKDKELLDLVRAVMTERNVSRRDMASEMETSPQNVSNWLERTESLTKMARAKLKAWLGDRYDVAEGNTLREDDYTRVVEEIMRSDMCDACKVKAHAISQGCPAKSDVIPCRRIRGRGMAPQGGTSPVCSPESPFA